MAVVLDGHALNGIHVGPSEPDSDGVGLGIDGVPDKLYDSANRIAFARQTRDQVAACGKWKVPHQTHLRSRMHCEPLAQSENGGSSPHMPEAPRFAEPLPPRLAEVDGLATREECGER